MYLQTTSGLMSRCVSLAQTYNLLKKNGKRKLTVVWPIDSDCGIGFWDVFDKEIFSDIDLRVLEDRPNQKLLEKCLVVGGFKKNIKAGNIKGFICCLFVRMGMIAEKIRHVELWLPQYWNMLKGTYIDYYPKSNSDWEDGKYRNVVKAASRKLHGFLNSNKACYARAYCTVDAEVNNNKIYDCIIFKGEYSKIVKEIVPSKEKFVGVHIRRGGHTVCINNSTTNAFVKRMKEICAQEPDTKFFLATDDIREEKYLTEIFGDRIVTQPDKKWGSEDTDEMKSGIIDMMGLAACNYILGSYTSVFSWFAAVYGGCELFICKE